MNFYGLLDTATEAFSNAPFLQPTNAAAVRLVMHQLRDNNGDNMLAAHPEDFELWKLGTYNYATGTITGEREKVIRVKDLVLQQQPTEGQQQ